MSGKVLLRAGVLGLLLLLAFQLWLIREGHLSMLLPSGLESGRVLPSLSVGVLSGGGSHLHSLDSLVASSDSCTLVVVISTYCPICARMRVTWAPRFQAWSQSLRRPVRTLWLAEENETNLRAFLYGFSSLSQSIDVMAYNAQPKRSFYAHLGLIGTPMVLLTDGYGRLVYGIGGDDFPPAHVVDSVCPVK